MSQPTVAGALPSDPAPESGPKSLGLTLQSGELLLRPPRVADAAVLARWWEDEEVQFGFCSEARSAEQIRAAFPELEAEARDVGHWLDFIIELDGRPIGSIWMSHWDLDEARCDLNILIGEPGLRGKGVARRAIRLLCAWAFPRMELRRIDICPRDDHIPAIRCYRGAGARFGEIRPEVVTFRGEVVCFRELYFLREDFELPDAASGG